jgi:hypothetical protein
MVNTGVIQNHSNLAMILDSIPAPFEENGGIPLQRNVLLLHKITHLFHN